MEGEIPAAVLNEEMDDHLSQDKPSELEVEFKMDDGSTSVLIDLPSADS